MLNIYYSWKSVLSGLWTILLGIVLNNASSFAITWVLVKFKSTAVIVLLLPTLALTTLISYVLILGGVSTFLHRFLYKTTGRGLWNEIHVHAGGDNGEEVSND